MQRAAPPADHSPPDEAAAHLRVALRLVFPGAVADDLASRASGDDAASAGRALRIARSRLRFDHALRRLSPRRDRGRAAPLGTSSAVRPDDAVALVARVALGLDTVTIADWLDLTPEQVATSLFAGRRALDRPIGDACGRFAAAIGEYDDPSADPDDRVALVTHTRSCQSCREAIDRSRHVDSWLHGQLDRIVVELGDLPPARRRPFWLRPELLVPAVLVGIIGLLMVGGIALFDSLTSPPHVPVSALSAGPSGSGLSGWLVTSGRFGQIQATNLRTGDVRMVIPADKDGSRWPLISPGRDRIALIRQTGLSGMWAGPTFHSDVYDLDGMRIGSQDWGAEDVMRWPFGWLDDSTLLTFESPVRSPLDPESTYQRRLATETRLLGVDVVSGEIHELLRGSVSYAIASPDSGMIALVRSIESQPSRSEIALRPISAHGLGSPVWTIEAEIVGLVWSEDSDTFYASITTGVKAAPGQSAPTATGELPALVAIDRTGSMTTIVQPGELGALVRPVTVSPDGRALVVAAGDPAATGVAYWRIDLATGERVQLTGSEQDGWPGAAVWSPDGTHVLMSVRMPFYLAVGVDVTGYPPGTGSSTGLFSVDEHWQRSLVGGWVDSSGELLAWLPDDRFVPSTPELIGDAPTITAPEPLSDVRAALRTSPDSAASPDGRFVILYDGEASIPVIWDRQRGDGRQVSGDASELAWLPNGRDVFGVVPFSDAANRLVGFSASAKDISVAIDFQRFDPVGLADNMQAHYERPLVSPDGAMMSFFVVDEARHEVALWLASWGSDPRLIRRWSIPADAIPPRPLAAAWIDARTLLFARADGWENGMPGYATLVRVVVDGDEVRVDDLTRIDGRGGDRGVVVREMAVSPDGAQLAYRLRHYRSYAPDRQLLDAVNVVALTDVTRPIELVSGGVGAGISWAPDSRWLTTATGGRIIIASSDGRTVRDVNDGIAGAAHPVWVGDEVWFSVADSSGAIWRVVVR